MDRFQSMGADVAINSVVSLSWNRALNHTEAFVQSFELPASADPPTGIPPESSFGQQSGSRYQRIPQAAPERLRPSCSPVPVPRRTDEFTVEVGKLGRNLVALLGPRLKAGARKFGKLAALGLRAESQRRRVVSEPRHILA